MSAPGSRHLIEMARLSRVNIQVAPLRAGVRAVANGPITMLRFPEAEMPDVVYLEQHASAILLQRKPAEQPFPQSRAAHDLAGYPYFFYPARYSEWRRVRLEG